MSHFSTIRRVCVSLLLMTAVSPEMAAQQAPAEKAAQDNTAAQKKRREMPSQKEMLRRAQSITAEIEQDLFHYPSNEQTLAKTELGKLWWKTDTAHARRWLESAVSDIEHTPMNESAENSRERVRLAENLLDAVAPLDTELEARVLKAMKNAHIKNSPGRAKSFGGDHSAIDVLRKQAEAELPGSAKRAAEIGTEMLAFSPGNAFVELQEKIREVDPAAANGLYSYALQASFEREDMRTLIALADFEYTARAPEDDPSTTPQALRQALLGAVVATLDSEIADNGMSTEVCFDVSAAGTWMSNYPADAAKHVQALTGECGVRYPPREN